LLRLLGEFRIEIKLTHSREREKERERERRERMGKTRNKHLNVFVISEEMRNMRYEI